MGQPGRIRDAEPAVEGKGLEVQAQMERQALAARPRELRPIDDRRIVEVRLALEDQAASPWVEGCVSENAGSFMQRSKIANSVG